MDLSNLTAGGSDGASGFDFGSLLNQLGSTGTQRGPVESGNGLGNSLAQLGNLAGNFIPGAGLVGQGLGAVANLFGNQHKPDGAGMFAGLHSPTLSPLDDALMFKEDAQVYVNIAKALGISVEEAAMGLAYDAQATGHSAAYVFDAYSAAGAQPAAVLGWILDGNKRNPGAKIVSGELGPARLGVGSVKVLVNNGGSPAIVELNSKTTDYGNQYAAGTPLGTSIYDAQAAMYPQGVPLGTPVVVTSKPSGLVASSQPLALAPAAASFSAKTSTAATAAEEKGSLLERLLAAMVDGAKGGATDVLADTDAAKQAKADYFKDFVATYQLPLAAGGIGLLLLIKKAFFDQNG